MPWLTTAMVIFLTVGIVWALLYVPPDYQQSYTTRILVVHVAVAVILAIVIVSIPKEKPPEIIATTLSKTNSDAPKRQLARSVTGKPSPPSLSSMAVVAAHTSSNIAAPTIELAPPTETLDLGTTFGTGAGFGGGLGSGGVLGGGVFLPDANVSAKGR